MAADAGGRGTRPDRRRPGVVAVVAAALVLGGSGAVVAGVLGQDDPPAPPAARSSSASPVEARPTPAPSGSASPSPSVTPPVASPTTVPAVPQPLPVAVSVPAIGVESELITVGLRPDGTLDVPEGPDYDKAAWFDGSPRPGAPGPAVIEGHVDSAENGPSVFYRLGDLAVGDEITVTREDGTTATFRVDDVQAYPKDDFPTLEVYGNTDDAQLRLITCGGEFDRGTGHYVDNTVVYASLVAPA